MRSAVRRELKIKMLSTRRLFLVCVVRVSQIVRSSKDLDEFLIFNFRNPVSVYWITEINLI